MIGEKYYRIEFRSSNTWLHWNETNDLRYAEQEFQRCIASWGKVVRLLEITTIAEGESWAPRKEATK
jgi:hypothetical protein